MSASSIIPTIMDQDRAVLDLRQVSRRFGHGDAEVLAVDRVSLQIVPGEIVLIMGPSGSGKTTLLSLMGALLRPSDGSISLDRTELSALSERRLPAIRLRRFGFIFQDFNLLSALTVQENVALVAQFAGERRRSARARAAALLQGLGLGNRLGFLPEQLSGGEKQRVAIARALINEPAVILADEPTANLDSKIGHEIMRLLRQIAKEQGRSVVIVSHDQRIRDIADRVLWLEDGAFQDVVSMAVDPVCGMSVERERAVGLERGGKAYYFCSKGCRDEFLATSGRPLDALLDLGHAVLEHLGAHRTPRPELDGDQTQGTGADDPGKRYSTGVSDSPDFPTGDAR